LDTKKTDESKFAFLLREILRQTTIPRIRISSLGPEYLDDEFFEVIKDPRIMPHFHLSIQSFSDNVLRAMRRNYTLKNLKKILKKFRTLKTTVPVSL
jgi:tRNA A37 methylthiotransferase MiaB